MKVRAFKVFPELNAKVLVLGMPPLYFILTASLTTIINLLCFIWFGGIFLWTMGGVVDMAIVVLIYLNYRDVSKKRYPLFSRIWYPLKRPQVTDSERILKKLLDAGKGF